MLIIYEIFNKKPSNSIIILIFEKYKVKWKRKCDFSR